MFGIFDLSQCSYASLIWLHVLVIDPSSFLGVFHFISYPRSFIHQFLDNGFICRLCFQDYELIWFAIFCMHEFLPLRLKPGLAGLHSTERRSRATGDCDRPFHPFQGGVL